MTDNPEPTAALTPAQAEVTDLETMTLQWKGVDLVVPATYEDWDADALEAMENSAAVTAVRLIIGSVAYGEFQQAFKKSFGHKPTVGEIGELLDFVVEKYGLGDAGN